MKLTIEHTTTYRYPDPVQLHIQYLRFYPLDRSWLHLTNFRLNIHPEPAGISNRIDAEGNPYHQVWFGGERVPEFSIEAKTEVRPEAFNPFNFIIEPEISLGENLISYPESMNDILQLYLRTGKDFSQELAGFTDEVRQENDNEIIRFLRDLVVYICQFWTHEHKEEDEVEMDASVIFQKKAGSCKELAWMLMMMLRSKGFATRFVSGYAYNSFLGDGHELHAWTEVFLPGAGWIGLDPSSGLFTNEFYIPVAASHNPQHTMPVSGYYKGKSTSKLDTNVAISVEEEQPAPDNQ